MQNLPVHFALHADDSVWLYVEGSKLGKQLGRPLPERPLRGEMAAAFLLAGDFDKTLEPLPDELSPLAVIVNGYRVIRGAIPHDRPDIYSFFDLTFETAFAWRASCDELVTVNQIADMVGAPYQRAYGWMMDRRAPAPLDDTKRLRQWRWGEVRAYLLDPEGPGGKYLPKWRASELARESLSGL